ncbi:MAG: ribbon-helix-helix protein, CopG family [Desulfurococcales archaeon]|nr:ribbon-helix-helix protein, CopG family [Desulfurococcales archaeon]
MKVVTFKIEEDLLEKIDKYALDKNMTRSEVIRRAIKTYLERETRKIVTKRLRIYS